MGMGMGMDGGDGDGWWGWVGEEEDGFRGGFKWKAAPICGCIFNVVVFMVFFDLLCLRVRKGS